jgi:general secretion pathway protein K
MLVLWIIVVLGTVTSGVVMSTRSTTAIAANYRARIVGRYAAESGVAVAVATLTDSLDRRADPAGRRDYLNRLDRALGANAQFTLGDGRVEVVLIDVGARLDVNTAGESSLTTLFGYFMPPLEAERAAAAIRGYIGGGATEAGGLQTARELQSLDELLRVPGLPPAVAERAAPYLTVDGDGTINRATASDTVLAAAGGELRDEPSRILIVSRGWRAGHSLTHEIQAVYAISGNELILVRWRERDL